MADEIDRLATLIERLRSIIVGAPQWAHVPPVGHAGPSMLVRSGAEIALLRAIYASVARSRQGRLAAHVDALLEDVPALFDRGVHGSDAHVPGHARRALRRLGGLVDASRQVDATERCEAEHRAGKGRTARVLPLSVRAPETDEVLSTAGLVHRSSHASVHPDAMRGAMLDAARERGEIDSRSVRKRRGKRGGKSARAKRLRQSIDA